MPLGTDSPGMLARLKSRIPNGWIQDFTLYDALGLPLAPVANAVLGGIADALAWVYGQAQIIKAQTRRSGTTGWLLDVDAFGFFGSWFLRRSGETDKAWRTRYTNEVFRPRVTRPAIIQALTDLTGHPPIFVEPWNPNDTAAYGYSYYGYGMYGSLLLPYQYFITVFRPYPPGIPNIAGYGYGFYGAPTTAYIDMSEVTSPVSDAEIYATVARNSAAGVIPWTAPK